jgi:hypothetical protein
MKIACAAWLVLSVSVLTAQTTDSWENGSWGRVYSSLMKRGHGIVGFPQIIAIPNKPFTATSIYTDQRMENGKNVGDPITAECTIARDDKGRIHSESPFESIEEGKLVIGGFDIYILDPVAHSWSRYFARADHSLPLEPTAKLRKPKLRNYWNPRNFVIAEPLPTDLPKDQGEENDSPATQESNTKNDASDPAPVIFIPTKDNLPVQWVDGLSAVIRRTIMKYGDKQQFFRIYEEWLSLDYGIDIRTTELRETEGIETVETKNIVPGPPDPALFKIPPGYVIELEH